MNTFGVYQTYYESNVLSQRSSSDISWIGSLQAFLLLIIGVITGPLYDAGYFRPLVFTGSFLVVFGMMMTSLCTEYWQVILAQGICVGFGSGCLFIPSVAIVSTYFSTRKSLATGIAASGSSLAGIIYSIVFHRLEPMIGFSWATRVIAFIMLGTLLIPLAVMRVRIGSGVPDEYVRASRILESLALASSMVRCEFIQTGIAVGRPAETSNIGLITTSIANAVIQSCQRRLAIILS